MVLNFEISQLDKNNATHAWPIEVRFLFFTDTQLLSLNTGTQ